MNLLAIDTCTEVCSVSLYTQGKKTSRFVEGVEKSSSLILPLCDEVFSATKLEVRELDAIVYTKGPGSFTGVRMCVAVVQGIAFAHDIPTYGFSTLELIGFAAAKKYQTNKVVVALDARMNEVYWGVYQNQILANEDLNKPEQVESLGQGFMGVGTGWGAYEQALSQQTGVENYVVDFYPKSENLIDLYFHHLDKNIGADDKLPLPTYLRNNVAQKPLK